MNSLSLSRVRQLLNRAASPNLVVGYVMLDQFYGGGWAAFPLRRRARR